MYADLYKSQHHVQISAMQIFTTALIILVALVIPATYIYVNPRTETEQVPYTAVALQQREADLGVTDNSEGRVAGASTLENTTNPTFRIPFTTSYVNLNSQIGLLTVGGAAMVFLGLCILLYVIFTDKPKQVAPLENINQAYEQYSLNRWN